MNKINTINLEGIGIFPKGDYKYNLHFKVAYNETMQKIHKEIWRELGKKINIKQKDCPPRLKWFFWHFFFKISPEFLQFTFNFFVSH